MDYKYIYTNLERTFYDKILNEKDFKKEYENHMELDVPDYGFFLSYGANGGYIPVGLYSLSGLVDAKRERLADVPEDLSNVFVELSECEYSRPDGTKKNGDKIYIPVLKLKELIEKHASSNCDFLVDALGENFVTSELMAAIHEFVSKWMVETPGISGDEDINLTGETLEDMDATLIFGAGEERVANYTVMPVSLGKIKYRILEKKYPKDPKLVEVYNHSYVDSNLKKKEDKYEIPGVIVEPGPGSPFPDITREHNEGRRR